MESLKAHNTHTHTPHVYMGMHTHTHKLKKLTILFVQKIQKSQKHLSLSNSQKGDCLLGPCIPCRQGTCYMLTK